MGNVTALSRRTTTARADLAANVCAFIARAGISKSAVARELNMSQPKFSRRTTGAEPFDIDEMGALADYFGVSLPELVAGRIDLVEPNAKKAPTPKGGGLSLPGLDSNQEPAGFKPSNVIEADFGCPQRDVTPRPLATIGGTR